MDGKKIKEIRIKSLLTQPEFAKELDVSMSIVQKWEQDGLSPSFKNQRKIIQFCKDHNIDWD